MPEWVNRIVGHGEEAPDQLLANPRNWRIHPKAQQDALGAVLNQVGVVGTVLVNRRTGFVIDGHLRVAMAISKGQPSVPVTYVDLSEGEEALILATFDPIGAMAAADREALGALLEGIATDDAAIKGLLEQVARANKLFSFSQDQEVLHAKLAERFIVPPFSVFDARQGYWQERKRAWLALGIRSELGRGETTRAGSPNDRRPSATGEGQYDGGDAFRYHNKEVSPAGSPRPAAQLENGHTVRGDGRGRRLTWVTGERPVEDLDETSRKNLAAGRKGLGRVFGQDLMRGEHEVGTMGAHPLHGPTGSQNPDGSLSYQPSNRGEGQTGTSMFDPVLCELAYRWFCPPNGLILDPFAGGSVRGIVGAYLGRRYVGIDLSELQIAANLEQGMRIIPNNLPQWIVGDSLEVGSLAPGVYDFVFTCPPYANLEVYSNDPRDLSTMPYAAFLDTFRRIIAACVGMLKPNRFAAICVGDIRDKAGFYRNFVSHTIAAFHDAGLALYNEAILVSELGSLPIRVGRQFQSGRKVGKTHQNVLVFIKGDPRKATRAVGDVECGDASSLSEGGGLFGSPP